jgi:RHS repeat-associated protein
MLLIPITGEREAKYSISIYSPASVPGQKDGDGFYIFEGAPIAVITIENPDTTGATTNKVRVTDGDGFVSDYEWKTNGWELVQGGGLRSQYKTTVVSNDLRTTTVQVSGTNGLLSCHTRQYQTYAFGERLVQEVKGTNAQCRTNFFEYYTNLSASTTGLLKQAIYQNGNWEAFEYHPTNRFKTNAIYGFLNEGPTTNLSLVRTIAYAYGTNAAPGAGDSGRRRAPEARCVVESIQGHEVSRRYRLVFPAEEKDIQCVTPAAVWNDANNLVTTTIWYTNNPNANRVKSIEHPDGTMEIFQYGFYTNLAGEIFRTNIMCVGAPDSNKSSIVDGTRKTIVLGGVGQRLSRTVTDIASTNILAQEVYSEFDTNNRPRKTTYLDGTSTWTEYGYGCCGYTTYTNREGTMSINYLDALKRRAAARKDGITVTNAMDAAGRVVQTTRIGTNGTQVIQAMYGYDSLGNQTAMTNALAKITQYSEIISNYQRIRTTTYPDGGTRVETYYRDGQLAKVTGTAAHPVRYEYGVVQPGVRFTKEIKLDSNGNDTSEVVSNFFDMLGRSYKTVYADGATRQTFFNIKGQMVKQVDADGVTTLYAYNSKGELEVTATDMNRNGEIDYGGTNGTDRIRQNVKSVTMLNGVNVAVGRAFAWITNNSAVSNLVSESRASTDGRRSWTISHSVLTNYSETACPGSGYRYVTNVAPDVSVAINQYLNGRLLSATRKDASGNQLSAVTYAYDAHGRQATVTDARNGTTTYSYDNADRVVSTSTPAPGTGQAAQTTAHTFDDAGRVTATLLPDGGTVYNAYSSKGELLTNWGARAYPVAYTYDAQGRRKTMITWKHFASRSGAATTTWNYDDSRGFLTSKVYDDGKGTTNTYTPAGRLRTRTWARGTATTYETNAAGDVVSLTYSDNATSNVVYTLDRLGRRTSITDGAGTRSSTYSDSGLILSETNSSGTLTGVRLDYAYDHLLRRTNVSLLTNSAFILRHSYFFDAASRLTNVSDGTYSATYEYLADSPLVSQITFRSNSTTRMTTTKQYDKLNRLLSIESRTGVSPVSSSSYSYNDANQRVRRTDADRSFWLYEYDSLGQLVSGKHYWSDGTPVAGQQFEYAFDHIGNRTGTKQGGDQSGAGLRPASYSANSLNQYTSRDVPSAYDIIGAAHAGATVSVNGDSSAYRHGEYFWKELSIGNTSAPVWQNVSIIASLYGTNQTNAGNLFVPKTPETFAHDADGNLTNDGRRCMMWDAENRLVEMESYSSAPTGSKRRLTYTYDSQSRLVRRRLEDGSSGSYVVANDQNLIWSDWLCLADLNATNHTPERSYLWGLDLRGSLQGAGGIGGLLAIGDVQSNISSFVAYDGHGNVTALVSTTDGSPSARYEYDPFGRTVRATGPMANSNPIRFSTKRAEDTGDLAYYGYRFYNSCTGRWLSRDSVSDGERFNRYAFHRNDILNFLDVLGLITREQVADIAQQLGLTLPPDHTQDTVIIQAIQQRLGISPADGLFGPQTVTAYLQWAANNGVTPPALCVSSDESTVRDLISRNWRFTSCRCLPYGQGQMVDILTRLFYWESLDTSQSPPCPWNTVGGPFGMTKERSTAVGIAQINDATADGIRTWLERNDGELASYFQHQYGDNWQLTARYDVTANIQMAMALLFSDLEANCDVESVLRRRWQAWALRHDQILREAGVNVR